MPEGHSIRHLADEWSELISERVGVSSPQGRFVEGAAEIDGREITGTDAHGKHLFIHFGDRWLHIHLGRYGRFTWHDHFGTPTPSDQTTRMRVTYADGWVDLRGPITCEVIDDAGKEAVHRKLGIDPLRGDDDLTSTWEWMRRHTAPIGAVLMHQGLIAGIGNIFRAETLWRNRIDPWKPCNEITPLQLRAIWDDTVTLMTEAVQHVGLPTGTIHMPMPDGVLLQVSEYGRSLNRTFVYNRAGLRCPRCGTPIAVDVLEGRKLYRCPNCQIE